MSSVITDDIAEIKQEIEAEEAADPTKKKLGVLFWICVGWIVLVAVMATMANLLPLPNPDLGNYNSVQNAGPGWGHNMKAVVVHVEFPAQFKISSPDSSSLPR